MRSLWINGVSVLLVFAAASAVVAKNVDRPAGAGKLTNVSYDPTRELYRDLNPRFAAAYQVRTGQKPEIVQSHGGSSRQARAKPHRLEWMAASQVRRPLGRSFP